MDQRVQSVITIIKGEYYRNVTLDEMAERVNLSVSRLRHLFKFETGESPMQYLKMFRMLVAKDLIETSFLSVKQVMVKVGFNDESHFVRDFQRIYGLTPAKHRAHRFQGNGGNSIPKQDGSRFS